MGLHWIHWIWLELWLLTRYDASFTSSQRCSKYKIGGKIHSVHTTFSNIFTGCILLLCHFSVETKLWTGSYPLYEGLTSSLLECPVGYANSTQLFLCFYRYCCSCLPVVLLLLPHPDVLISLPFSSYVYCWLTLHYCLLCHYWTEVQSHDISCCPHTSFKQLLKISLHCSTQRFCFHM